MIDITFDEIGEHIEKGDLKEWLNELRILDAIKHLRTDEPQTDKWSHDCIGCGNNDTCEFAFTDAVKICRYINEPQTDCPWK